MMPPAEDLDLESIAITYLKAQPTMVALVAALQMGSSLHRTWAAGTSALRIRRIGGIPTEQAARRLRRYRLQVDAFAGTELAAFAVAARAKALLEGLEATTTGGAVITAVEEDLAVANVGDPDSDSERYLFGVVLYAHPATA
jgi:hypothetical protein